MIKKLFNFGSMDRQKIFKDNQVYKWNEYSSTEKINE